MVCQDGMEKVISVYEWLGMSVTAKGVEWVKLGALRWSSRVIRMGENEFMKSV